MTQHILQDPSGQAAMLEFADLLSLKADPPQPAKLPPDDILGVTVLFLSCSYQGKVRSLVLGALSCGLPKLAIQTSPL